MKINHKLLVATISALFIPALQAGTINTPSPRPAEGAPYDWIVTLDNNDSSELTGHVGAWSWEDNALFDAVAGELPVGWTHTSKWIAVTLTSATRFVVRMERQEGVAWPGGGDPNRVASVNSMFPSFTVWKGWDTDGEQDHTFDNRGNPVWAESLSLIAFVDNSTEASIERSYILPAGKYTLAIGSNAPSTDANRQGFKATLISAPIATQVAVTNTELPGHPGVTFKRIYAPTVNDADQIAFRTQLSGTGITGLNDTAIVSDTGDAPLVIVAREGNTDLASGSTFTLLEDPVTDNHDNVVFRAKVKQKVADVTAANDQGIYRYVAATGATQLIAREGAVAPGVSDGATFLSFPTAVADSAGGAYLAYLKRNGTTITTSNDEGVWVFNDAGISTLIARQGALFEVAPGDSRTIRSLNFLSVLPASRGVGRSTNGHGGRVLMLTFTDGTTGVFHLAE